MDSQNQQGNYINTGMNAQSGSRVYINPNFQRNNRDVSQNTLMSLKSQLHQPHQHTNLQTPSVSRPKIYVNPNFVRTSAPIPPASDNYLTLGADNVRINSNRYYEIPNVSVNNARRNISVLGSYYASANSASNMCYVNSSKSTMTAVTIVNNLPNVTPNVLPQSIKHHVAEVAKSRYSLVRKNNDPVKIAATPNRTVTKMKISKYKTVSVDHAKNLQTEKDNDPVKIVTTSNRAVTKMRISKYKTVSVDHAKNMQTEKEKLRPIALPKTNSQVVTEKPKRIIRTQFIQSRFKLVQKNIGTTSTKIEPRTPIKRKYPHNSSKVLLRSNQKLKSTVELSKFKKNNIPCPLYRKYGTCLRNSRGKCEFLHDRKHVSICRKFLKGICHDKTCLLSHEVTVEKMPTCYFYLKGMCTKENCPYLHIKLNEKANICLDFLKGYCEKGNKCLNRHVNICPDYAIKGTCIRKPCPYPHKHKQNKVKTGVLNQSIKSIVNIKPDKRTGVGEKYFNRNSNVEEEKGQDCRYYKEVVEEVSPLEVIKPTRCKLGALPSFIQL